MTLYWLTMVVVAAVVLVLAGYLIAIAAALWAARRNVAELADDLERIADHTAPLDAEIGEVAAALERIDDGFADADRRLSAAAEKLGLL